MRLPFLNGVSDEDVRIIGRSLWQRTFAQGDTILRTGEYGDAAFFILEGQAEVRLPAHTRNWQNAKAATNVADASEARAHWR